MGVGQDRLAIRAGADVIGAVGHVARVRRVDGAGPARVRHEDPVLALGSTRLEVCGRGAEVRAVVAAHADLPAAVAPVEPDLVATAAAREELARGEILHRDAVDLRDEHAVAPDRRAGRVVRAEVLVARPRSSIAVHPGGCRRRRPDCGPCRADGSRGWSRSRHRPRRPRCRRRGSRPVRGSRRDRRAPSPPGGLRRPRPGWCGSRPRASGSCRRAALGGDAIPVAPRPAGAGITVTAVAALPPARSTRPRSLRTSAPFAALHRRTGLRRRPGVRGIPSPAVGKISDLITGISAPAL